MVDYFELMAKNEIISNAIAAAHDDAAAAAPEQLEIFDLMVGSRSAGGMVGPLGDDDDAIKESVSRGRGRPAGSINKRTQAFADYLLTRFQSPVVGLLKTASMTPAELLKFLIDDFQEQFKVKVEPKFEMIWDCVKVIQKAATEAAPYTNAKLPGVTAEQNDGKAPTAIILGGLSLHTHNGAGEKSAENEGEIIDVEVSKKGFFESLSANIQSEIK